MGGAKKFTPRCGFREGVTASAAPLEFYSTRAYTGKRAHVVSFSDEDRLIGQAAQSQAAGNPTNTIFDAKRLIGRNIKEPLVVEDIKRFPFKVVPGPDGETPSIEVQYQGKTKRFAPEEISAMVLLKMKTTA